MQEAFQYLSDRFTSEPWTPEATAQLHQHVLLAAQVLSHILLSSEADKCINGVLQPRCKRHFSS